MLAKRKGEDADDEDEEEDATTRSARRCAVPRLVAHGRAAMNELFLGQADGSGGVWAWFGVVRQPLGAMRFNGVVGSGAGKS